MSQNVLVITGGSRGIGYATIQRFIAAGWRAVNISRTPCDLADVENISIDLTSSTDIQGHATQLKVLLQDAGQVAVVHNAAAYPRDSVDNIELDTLQHAFALNVVAPALLNKVLIPFLPKKSAIIFIGSTLSRKGVANNASYIVSKHALAGLMKATCQDLSEKGIRSLSVYPGLVDTKLMNDNIDQQSQQYLLENVIIGKRLLQPEEIADVIYFAATAHAINGSTIEANLGQVAD